MLVHTLRVYSTVLVFKVKVGCSDHQHQLLQPHNPPVPEPAPSVPSSPHHPWSLSVSFCFLNAAPVQERLSFPKVVRSAYWSGCRLLHRRKLLSHRIRKVELQVSTLYFRRSSSAAAAAAAAVPAAVSAAVSATATSTAQAMFSAPERGVFRRFAFETPFHPKLWTASLCLHDLL